MYGFIIHKEIFASEKHKRSVIAALRGFWSLLEKVPDQQDDEPGSPGEGRQDDVTDDGEDAYVLHGDSFLCGLPLCTGEISRAIRRAQPQLGTCPSQKA